MNKSRRATMPTEIGQLNRHITNDHILHLKEKVLANKLKDLDHAKQHGPVIHMGMEEGRLFCVWPRK